MTFEYRNAANDRLAVAPLGDVVWLKTTPGGCEVPPDRVEEVVAGIRDAARQAAGQTTAEQQPVCKHCGKDVEDRGHPLITDTGNWYAKWVHVPGGYTACHPQQGGDSTRAEPVVEQPAEAQLSVRNVIEHALTVYYQDSSAPSAVARALLSQHRADILREAADALDESETLRDLTDDHMHDVHAAANELRRMAEEQP